MTKRSIIIQLGTDEFEWRREALERCARAVIDPAEAGQRDARLSPMICMIADAFISNSTATTWLLRELKGITVEGSNYTHPALTETVKQKINHHILEVK